MNGYLLAGRTLPLHSNKKKISTRIVRQIVETDCCRCPYETEAPYFHGVWTLNVDVKDMLNPGTSFRSCPLALYFPNW